MAAAVHYCFDACEQFVRRSVTSTTFNELLYRLLSAWLILLGVFGLESPLRFLPVVLLISLVTLAETAERWLAVPHATVISLATVLLWFPFATWHHAISGSLDALVATPRLHLLGVYAVPLVVTACTGALVTLSDVWKAQLDVSALLAILPAAAEVVVFSLLHLATGAPYVWGLATALCLCASDHSLVLKRALQLEQSGAGLRHDVPQLMRSSLLMNVVVSMFAFGVVGQLCAPCHVSSFDDHVARQARGVHNSTTDCTPSFYGPAAAATSSATGPAFLQLAQGLGAVVGGLVLAYASFLFARRAGAPKTQTLSVVIVCAIAIFTQVFTAKFDDEGQPNVLYTIHGAEPLVCFLLAACTVYGWKKNRRPGTTVLDNVHYNVKQARNNIKVLLYAVNVGLHCFLGYLILVYTLSGREKFLESFGLAFAGASDFYDQEFRSNQGYFLIATALSALAAALAKSATVFVILKWKFRSIETKIAVFFGVSCTAKGTIAGVLSCYILLVRLVQPRIVTSAASKEGGHVQLIHGAQLLHAVHIMIALIVANLAVNPLAVLITSVVGRGWNSFRGRFVQDVELS